MLTVSMRIMTFVGYFFLSNRGRDLVMMEMVLHVLTSMNVLQTLIIVMTTEQRAAITKVVLHVLVTKVTLEMVSHAQTTMNA